MSYSTRENLADTEKQLAFAKELAELYPDARASERKWFSGDVALAECDVVELQPVVARGERSSVEVFCGKRLPSGGVVWSSQGYQAFRTLPLFLRPGQDGGVGNKFEALRLAVLAWAATK